MNMIKLTESILFQNMNPTDETSEPENPFPDEPQERDFQCDLCYRTLFSAEEEYFCCPYCPGGTMMPVTEPEYDEYSDDVIAYRERNRR